VGPGLVLNFFCDAAILAIIQKRKLAKYGDKKVENLRRILLYTFFFWATKWTYCLNMAISEKKNFPSKSGNFGAIFFTTKH
jgi:hypothetical protein